MNHHARRGLKALAFSLATLVAATCAADAETDIKMILNWKYQGPQGLLLLAEDNGYFAAEGLKVTMDQGNGSGAAVPQVANGAYDIGFGDVNALVEFAAKDPDAAPVAVYMMYNKPPFTVAVLADSPIKTPADFPGHRLGGAANDGALKLFPALCATAKVDCSTVTIENMQPNLREQMLRQSQVDGVFGYVNTIRFSAKLIGMDPDKEIRFINYGDYGMDLYSNAIIVSKPFLKAHPEAVEGFLRALNKSVKDAIADPDAALASVMKREPLLNAAIERERFDATLADEMSHPEVGTIGLGDVDDARLARSIDMLVKAKELPRPPTPDQIFDRQFLPPLVDRPTALN